MTKTIFFSFYCFFVLLSPQAFSSDFKVSVIELSSHKALARVRVDIYELNENKRIITRYTDNDGELSGKLDDGLYRFELSIPGYKSFVITDVSLDHNVNLYVMLPKIGELSKSKTLVMYYNEEIPYYSEFNDFSMIYGVVVDREIRQPLPGANLVVEGTGLGAVATIKGDYFIPIPKAGVYTITASYIGYQNYRLENVRVNKNQSVLVNFELPSTAVAVSDLVVTYDNTKSHPKDEKAKERYLSLKAMLTTRGFDQELQSVSKKERWYSAANAAAGSSTVKESERGDRIIETLSKLPDAVAKWVSSSKNVVVTIGINKYQSPKLKKLIFAVPDAKAVGNFFQLNTNFKIYDELYDTRATKSNIGNVVDRLNNDRSIDRIVFYFAGHGYTTESISGDTDVGFFMPADGDPDKIISTAISMNEVSTWARTLRARHVLFIFDACFSGIVGGAARASRDYNLDFLAQYQGRHVITAGTKNDEAFEYNNLGHGALTYFLLKGLEGEADSQPRDRVITLSELTNYLEDKVSNFTGGKQRPQTIKFVELGDGELFVELRNEH